MLAAKLWAEGGNTRRDNYLLARLVGVGGRAELSQRFICDAPPGAGGRRPVAQEGAAQMDRNGSTLSRICEGKGAGTGSPAKPRKEALRNLGAARIGS